jgi:hypothetical protein
VLDGRGDRDALAAQIRERVEALLA